LKEPKSSKAEYNILVVDDDPEMLELLREILEPEGYNISVASDGRKALDVVATRRISLVLLDIMLPDIDGRTICKIIRAQSQLPIIMVTGKNNEDEKVDCLKSGADDYITKPFSPRELAARVMTVLRRSLTEKAFGLKEYHFLDLTIDFRRRRVTIANNEIDLSMTEYSLLQELAVNAGKLVTNEVLLKEVWGEEYTGDSHLLQVNISRLRQKLNSGNLTEKYIATKPGLGYILKKR
jgi:DNA-binding response OmpR family regulator